jgi:hypothetical protein
VENIKVTKLKDGWQSEICLVETANGECYVRKNYSECVDPNVMVEEWETLVYLHGKGFRVPRPLRKDSGGIHMQYIEKGALWDIYMKSDSDIAISIENGEAERHPKIAKQAFSGGFAAKAEPIFDGIVYTKKRLVQEYAKLLHDLHAVDISDIAKPCNFVENELAEIRSIIEKHELNDYLKVLKKLEAESSNIAEQPPCFIHRDYHPWNVLVGDPDELYVIDIFNTQGDYRFDAGWAYVHMRRDSGQPESVRFAEDFLCEYLKLRPEASEDFEFFKQLANLRWLANVRPGKMSEKSEFWQYMIKCAEHIFKV